MRAEVRLGLRLAAGGQGRERLRAVLVIGASAFGVLVLLSVFAVAGAESADRRFGGLDREHEILLATIVAFLTVPVVILLAAVNRLSAAARDRRLAALRLLGLSPARTRLVAATESGVLGIAGTAIGSGLFLALQALVRSTAVAGSVSLAGREWPAGALFPQASQFAAIAVGVPLLAIVVSLAPTRAMTAAPLLLRREGPASRPSPLRLVPVLAGTALLSWSFTYPQSEGRSGDPWSEFGPFLAGSVLTGLGLPLAVPVLVRLLADLLTRLRRPAFLVAARRLQLEPAATTRIVAGLLFAVFVVTGARSLVTSWEQTSQYREAHRIETVGPQVVEVDGLSTEKVAELGSLPYVRDVVRSHRLATRCENDCANEPYLEAFVGTCAGLRKLTVVHGCRDDEIAWLRPSYEDDPRPGTRLTLYDWSAPAEDPRGVEITIPEKVLTRGEYRIYDYVQEALFVPIGTPGAAEAAATGQRWQLLLDPGPDVREAFTAVLKGARPEQFEFQVDLQTLAQVNGYRAILWTVTGVVILVGLVAFAITTVDRAMERRRQLAALRALGAPVRLMRRSQLLQMLIPLALGIPLAGLLGLLAGTAYLAFAGEREHAPWGFGLATVVAALLATALAAAATLPATGHRLTPDLLRRE